MNFSIVSEYAGKMDSINYGTLYIYAFINKWTNKIHIYMNSLHCFYLGTINFFNFHELRDILYIYIHIFNNLKLFTNLSLEQII